MEFKTISNNGSINQFSNSCIWISVWHFIKYVQNNELIDVAQIRKDAEFNYPNNQEFDLDIPAHKDSLVKLLNKYNLCIHIYYANTKKDNNKWLGAIALIFGDAQMDGFNVIPVVAYGSHFELIVSGTETTLPLELNQKLIQMDKISIKTFDTNSINVPTKKYNDGEISNVQKICDDMVLLKDNVIPLQNQIELNNEQIKCYEDKINTLQQSKKISIGHVTSLEKELGKLNNSAKSTENNQECQTSNLVPQIMKILEDMKKISSETEIYDKQLSQVMEEIKKLEDETHVLNVKLLSINAEINDKEKKISTLLE